MGSWGRKGKATLIRGPRKKGIWGLYVGMKVKVKWAEGEGGRGCYIGLWESPQGLWPQQREQKFPSQAGRCRPGYWAGLPVKAAAGGGGNSLS